MPLIYVILQTELYELHFVAIDRRYQNQNGERETDFINCVMWQLKLQKTFAISLVRLTSRVKDVFKLVAMITNKAKSLYMTRSAS